jgi:GDP-L-fucose synthase
LRRGARIVVAGGAGFIGSSLVRRLVSEGLNVRATTHSSRPRVRDERIEYVRAELTMKADCAAIVKGMDYVFMCAAVTSGAGVIASDPLAHVTSNLIMNSLMLEASYRARVKKFIWISSNVVYPPSGRRPVREDQSLARDPYESYFASGWMKRYTEILCRLYSEKLKPRMPAVVVRPSNIYGPFDKFDPESSHVTAALVRKVCQRESPIVVWGDGRDVRDVLYIDDFVEALVLAAEKMDGYDPINVAFGKGYTVNAILKTLLEIDGRRGERIVYDKSRPSMIPARLLDTNKAERLLGFRARTSLREGLSKTVDWYKATQVG